MKIEKILYTMHPWRLTKDGEQVWVPAIFVHPNLGGLALIDKPIVADTKKELLDKILTVFEQLIEYVGANQQIHSTGGPMKLVKSEHHSDVWLINTDDGKAVGEIRGREHMAEMEVVLISPDFHKVAIAERDAARRELKMVKHALKNWLDCADSSDEWMWCRDQAKMALEGKSIKNT